MQETALSLAMLMVFALPIGAFVLWRQGGSRTQITLMLVLAAVMAANVAIWVIPSGNVAAPPQRIGQSGLSRKSRYLSTESIMSSSSCSKK